MSLCERLLADGVKRIPLDEDELARLIREGRDGALQVRVTFPGGDLIVAPENDWALTQVAIWRRDENEAHDRASSPG